MKRDLTQEVFMGQPESVDWCGVDFDGNLNFGIADNPRYTWASERWRGFEQIGETIKETDYKPLTSLKREIKKMFPVTYNGKLYYEKDCDEMFLSYYECPEALINECSVYASDNMIIFPDGKMEEF